MACVSSLYTSIYSVPLLSELSPPFSLYLPSFQLTITGNNISRFSPLPCKCRSITFSQLVVLTSSSACPSSVFLLSLPLLSLSFVSNAIYSRLFTVESLYLVACVEIGRGISCLLGKGELNRKNIMHTH